MADLQDSYFQELSIRFSDGTVEVLHIERRETGTHVPRPREKPKEWAKLACHKCSCCPLPDGIRYCPAALSLQATMGKLRPRTSVERVRATAVDGDGRTEAVEADLQSVGATLVRFAVFETACPVGYRLKPYVAGLPAFTDSLSIMRHITRRILEKHGGSVESARRELNETLGPLQEVYIRLCDRIRSEAPEDRPKAPDGTPEVIQDAVPNSIVQADAVAKRFALRADRLLDEVAAELGWGGRR